MYWWELNLAVRSQIAFGTILNMAIWHEIAMHNIALASIMQKKILTNFIFVVVKVSTKFHSNLPKL